jgi:hypothetical protein
MRFILKIEPIEGKEKELNYDIILFLKQCNTYKRAEGEIEDGEPKKA